MPCRHGRAAPGGIRASISLPNLRENSPSRRFHDLPRGQRRANRGAIRASTSLPNLREGWTLPQVTHSATGATLARDGPSLPSPRIS